MKHLILTLFTLVLSTHAFAQTVDANAKLPICNEDMLTLPCKSTKKDAYMMIADMMLENRKGLNGIAVKAPGIKKGYTGGFMIADVRMSYLKDEELGKHLSRSTVVYEILMNDCRGTDACMGNYLWTVTQVTESDGYSYESKYTNTLVKTELNQLDPESEDK